VTKQELQQLKMAWLAAKEAGDTHTQLALLRDHPAAQRELIDFIAAYSASGASAPEGTQEPAEPNAALEALAQRAYQKALQRVFAQPQAQPKTLTELRKAQHLLKRDVAQGLRISMIVWDKLEQGAIQVASLSQRQLERLAQFFQVSAEQFASLLENSHQPLAVYRRQTRQAARAMNRSQQTPRESFADVVKQSDMSEEDQRFWLE
jgi:transcriptional regulator with XRE-family HTH domain